MNDTTNNWKHTYDHLQNSAGNQHINRTYKRSFTLNIFLINTIELLQLSDRIKDSNEGLDYMMADNREEGNQVHREMTRLVHNFVASAKTLVEHTRNFMKEHYSDTSVYEKYCNQIKINFVNEPITKFIEDLRNYMLHNGLPPTQMYLEMKSDPNLGNNTGFMKTGIRLKTDELLKWKNWTAPAKKYLENADDFIDIYHFAEEYSRKVKNFHVWLNKELDDFHAEDLNEFEKLKTDLNSYRTETYDVIDTEQFSEKNTSFKQEEIFGSNEKLTFNKIANDILTKVEELSIPSSHDTNCPNERIPSATITEDKFLETPIFWTTIQNKTSVIFIKEHNKNYGLTGEALVNLQQLIQQLLELKTLKNILSYSCLEHEILKWIRLQFLESSLTDFTTTIINLVETNVREYTILIPISNFQVESIIEFGPAKIIPLTRDKFDSIEKHIEILEEKTSEQSKSLCLNLRKKLQGLSALEFKFNSERTQANEYAQSLAEIIINLICFLSPEAKLFPSIVNINLLGRELAAVSNIITYDSKSFSYKTELLTPPVSWYISEEKKHELTDDLSLMETLIYPERLNQFSTTVRSSLLMFSIGSKSLNPIDRITYSLLSIENLLLKHSAEPIEFNIENRMKNLIKHEDLIDVKQYIREAYRIKKRKSIKGLTELESHSIDKFIHLAHLTIYIAFRNIPQYTNLSEFIDSLD